MTRLLSHLHVPQFIECSFHLIDLDEREGDNTSDQRLESLVLVVEPRHAQVLHFPPQGLQVETQLKLNSIHPKPISIKIIVPVSDGNNIPWFWSIWMLKIYMSFYRIAKYSPLPPESFTFVNCVLEVTANTSQPEVLPARYLEDLLPVILEGLDHQVQCHIIGHFLLVR